MIQLNDASRVHCSLLSVVFYVMTPKVKNIEFFIKYPLQIEHN